ncbi:unnamed protein product [Rhodiola kirilowii]
MDEHNHESFSVSPVGIQLKRKRGRPRKDRGFTFGPYSPAPYGKGLASTMPPHVEPMPTTQPISVGQPIGGVIEAVFDAGYMLNVKLSSGTTLRGVVFKPGHYVPFSNENDVAPNAELVKRNEVPIPSGTQIMLHGSTSLTKRRRRRKSNGNVNGFPHAYNGAPVDHLPVIAASPISSRGKFVPVILSPTFSLPDWIPPRTPAPHLVSSINKQLSPVALEAPPLVNGLLPSHLYQNSPYQYQNNSHFPAAASSGNLSAIPFQQLLDEVIKRTQSPYSTEIHVHNQASDLEEPLSAEPLQAIQPNPRDNRPREGKKIELYQKSCTNSKQPLLQNGNSSPFQIDDGSSGAELGGKVSSNSYQNATPGT